MTKDKKDQIYGTIALAVLVGVPLCFVLGPIPLIAIVVFGFIAARNK